MGNGTATAPPELTAVLKAPETINDAKSAKIMIDHWGNQLNAILALSPDEVAQLGPTAYEDYVNSLEFRNVPMKEARALMVKILDESFGGGEDIVSTWERQLAEGAVEAEDGR